ncbi:hypothetical protein QOZ80_5BG0453330 [Eleusine coracana subsp. coracana]|nr:hypothetical protein QOZ80_5BG0453330 [Eleusine coracana subsp. coracana]
MDSTRQTETTNPNPSTELQPPAAALPREATGDSEESDADVWVGTAGRSSETDDDDAESCSGGFSGGVFIGIASDDAREKFEEDDDMTVEVDMAEVDSKMAVPWWRRTGEYAASGGDGGCAPPECGGKLAGGGRAAAESNRLFWEACIAHGY